MNIGIISEFNPFHKGHKHLIDSVKNENDNIIAVMSSNFVQRGEFAVENKFERAKVAIKNGADLVVEIPTPYSTLSAEGFAKSGVFILESTGIADAIAFGAENENIDELKIIANKLLENETIENIKEEMKKGLSFPTARKNVINSNLIDSPNNILAVEYLKETKLKPIAVKRIGKGHDTDDEIYSASEIRKKMYDTDTDFSSAKHCEKAILAKLRMMNKDDFSKITDVTDGLENRIFDAVRNATSLEECYDLIKTKRYTHSRIRRIILRAYLGIDKSFNQNVPYIKILGFNSKGRELLKEMKETASLPVLMRHSDSYNLTPYGKKVYEKECLATDLFSLGYKTAKPCGEEQRAKVVIV